MGAAAYAPPPPPPPAAAGKNLSASAFNAYASASAPPGANAAALSFSFDYEETMELEQALRRWEDGQMGGQAAPVASVSDADAAAAAVAVADRGEFVRVSGTHFMLGCSEFKAGAYTRPLLSST